MIGSKLLFQLAERLGDPWRNREGTQFVWKSTGLYAKAGTFVEVTVPKEIVNKILVSHFFEQLCP